MAGTEPGGAARPDVASEDAPATGVAQSRFPIPGAAALSLLGSRDENLRVAEDLLAADVHVRGNEVTLTGTPADVAFAERVFTELVQLAAGGQQVGPDTVRRTIGMLSSGDASPAEVLSLNIVSRRGKTIRPKTLNQKRYVDAIDKHTIVFGIGPAGTGKTYLAMAKAVQALQSKQVTRIVLTRPAVEAGERLGYLPGTLNEKIDPYLRPLYDALHDMVEPESIPRLMQAGTIEIAPLAYMRGRAQPVGTPVLTPDGFRPIGELQVGDLVIGSNGEPTPVLGVYPQGEKDIYRLTAGDGSSTLCCGDHLWAVKTASDKRRGKPWRVLETKQMLGKLRAAHARRYELPMLSAPACHPEREVPMDPYALGLLLGDGCITEQATRVVDPAPRRGRTTQVAGVLQTLEPVASRLLPDSVPELYLRNSAAIRLAVLQGLLDSTVGAIGRRGRIQYRAASPRLRDTVIELVRSLGGTASVKTRAANLIDIRLPQGVEPFRLARKRERYHAEGGGGRPMRFIDRIEPAGRAEAVCIQVAAADSLYVTEDYLVTHNTLNDAFIILDEAQNTTPEQMKMFLTRLGFGAKIVVTGDITQIDLPGGQRSGLRVVREILDGVEDVHFAELTSQDVVRHRLVGDIVDAYEKWQAVQDAQEQQNGGWKGGRR